MSEALLSGFATKLLGTVVYLRTPHIADMARVLRVSERTVQRHLQALECSGALVVHRVHGRGLTNRYYVRSDLSYQ